MIKQIKRLFSTKRSNYLNLEPAHLNNKAGEGILEFEFNPEEFQLHRIESLPEEFVGKIKVHKEELLRYYEQMQLIRRMEMKADSLYKSKLIRGKGLAY